jgi:hypothetical protein
VCDFLITHCACYLTNCTIQTTPSYFNSCCMMSGPLASSTSTSSSSSGTITSPTNSSKSDSNSSNSMDGRMCSAEASAAGVSWGKDVKDFHLLDKQVTAILWQCYQYYQTVLYGLMCMQLKLVDAHSVRSKHVWCTSFRMSCSVSENNISEESLC